jgi:hypothetical protein
MDEDINRILKNLNLAHYDGELKGIAVVYITGEDNKIESELSFNAGCAYAINTALDLLKGSVLDNLRINGATPWRNRE